MFWFIRNSHTWPIQGFSKTTNQGHFLTFSHVWHYQNGRYSSYVIPHVILGKPFIQFTVLDMMDMSGKHNLKFLCSWSLHLWGEMGHEHKLFWHVDSPVRAIQEHWCLFLTWGFWMWNNTREGKRTWAKSLLVQSIWIFGGQWKETEPFVLLHIREYVPIQEVIRPRKWILYPKKGLLLGETPDGGLTLMGQWWRELSLNHINWNCPTFLKVWNGTMRSRDVKSCLDFK